jgi:hypothetical protein
MAKKLNIKKVWYKSTTILINLAGILSLVISFFLNSGMVTDKEIIAILIAVANILNRLRVTSDSPPKPISLK